MPPVIVIAAAGIGVFMLYVVMTTMLSRALGGGLVILPRVLIAILLGFGLSIVFSMALYQLSPALIDEVLAGIKEPAMLLQVSPKVWLVIYVWLVVCFVFTAFLLKILARLPFFRSVAALITSLFILVNMLALIMLMVSALGIGVPTEIGERMPNERSKAELDAMFESFQKNNPDTKGNSADVVDFEFEEIVAPDVSRSEVSATTANESEDNRTVMSVAAVKSCIERLDQQALQQMENLAIATQTQLQLFCDEGDRNKAQDLAIKYSLEHYASSITISSMACMSGLGDGVGSKVAVPVAAELESIHICDHIERTPEFYR